LIDNQPAGYGLIGIERPDVAARYPDVPQALNSGFVTTADVSTLAPGAHQVSLRINLTDQTSEDVGQRNVTITPPFHHERRGTLRPLLACIFCHLGLEDKDGALVCPRCGLRAPLYGDVPVFQGGGPEAPQAPVSSNGYSDFARALIGEYAGKGLILDCGAGYPTESYPHVVQYDLFRFPSTDVAGDVLWLPFLDNSFDAVISQAVMEHVRDPFRYAFELHRVLKPGGKVLVDSAFMQPQHAYPFHYFNTTLTGLQELMQPFEAIDAGVGIHQKPWVMLNWVLSRYAAGMGERDRRRFLSTSVGDILRKLSGGAGVPPFEPLEPGSEQELAAGVYFLGRKPEA